MLIKILISSVVAIMAFFHGSSKSGVQVAQAIDRFATYAELARVYREGIDYSIETAGRGSKALVLAIHGGRIEWMSADLARAIAGTDLNLYIFEGMKPADNWELHVTSENFDEPRALAMAADAWWGISVHGFANANVSVVCVGGGNTDLASEVARHLRKVAVDRRPFEVHYPCAIFAGKRPTNIVNRPREGGVQLELSTRLRSDLESEPLLLLEMAGAVRSALESTFAHR